MRLPSLFTAAVAGLWQNPFLPVTSTRHVHITRTVTAVQSKVNAMRVGTSTLIMEYVPASIMAKTSSQGEIQSSAPSALDTPSTATFSESTSASVHCGDLSGYSDPSGHLELRSADDTTSTRNVQITMTVQSVEATVYATSVGFSVSTLVSLPESLVAEASAKVLAESSIEISAISSAEEEAMDHSTVGALVTETPETKTKASIQSVLDTANATSLNTAGTARIATTETGVSHTSVATSLATSLASVISTDTAIPFGLELRSDSDETSTSHIQVTKTIAETQSTTYEMQLSSTTSSMTSVPSTIIAIASSEAAVVSSTVAVDAASASETTQSGIKSNQSALIENKVTSSSSSSQESTTYQKIATTIGSLSSSSTSATPSAESTTSSIEITTGTQSTASTISSDKISTTLTTARKPSTSSSSSSPFSEAASITATSIVGTSKAATTTTTGTTYASEASSASVTADNEAGASGSDTSSFKLSQGGFVAIISVVSIGVGLGIIFLILFVIAKRRQWRVRASISRASHRLTRRSNPAKPSAFRNEKPTLPTVQPRSAIPAPQRPEIRNAGMAGVGADRAPCRNGTGRMAGAVTRFPVRIGGGVREIVGSGALGHGGDGRWAGTESRRGGNTEGRRGGNTEGRGGSTERKKPELRVDTRLAREMEEGGVREEGNWVRKLVWRVRGRK